MSIDKYQNAKQYKINKTDFKEDLHIYCDHGEGFSELNLVEVDFSVDEYGKIDLQIPTIDNVKQVKIALNNCRSILNIENLQGYTTEYYSANFITDGIILNKKIVLFPTNKSDLIINIEPKTERIEMKFEIQYISNEIALELCDNVQNSKNKIRDLEKKILHVENDYNIVVNSAIWRITKPLRTCLDFLKKGKQNIFSRIKPKTKTLIYNIDSFSYQNNILEFSGWIFNPNKKINRLMLLLVNRKIEYRKNILSFLKRQDVYEVYNNKNSLYSGFYTKIRLENVSDLLIYLEIEEDERVLVNKVKISLLNRLKYYIKKINSKNIKKLCILIKKNQVLKVKDAVKKLVIEEIDSNFNNIDFMEFKKNNINVSVLYPDELYKYTVDIIVPIYNGYEFFKRLFETIDKTKMHYRLILVNDKSSDIRIAEFLDEYIKNNRNVVLIENDENLGFVKTVNKAFNIAVNNIALLNTDIELPDMWLERLMLPIILNNNVASSTPFTNCGTICSFPVFCQDNDIFEHLGLDTIDSEFKSIMPKYINIPTGVGFCMGINKKVLDEIGFFDDETFAKGYGEENDWCQRAIKAGYKNVHVENLYVYHKHGGSFLSEEKKKLIERNSLLLSKKHPNYDVDVARYCNLDPTKNIRNYVMFSLLSKKNQNILVYFDHNIGGGATSYLNNIINKNIFCGETIITIRYDIFMSRYLFNYKYKQYDLSYYYTQFQDLIDTLSELDIKTIYINELVTYPDIYDIFEKLKQLKNARNINLTMLLHDFFCICPTINLLNDNGCYCGIPKLEICEKCMKNNEFNNYFDYGSMKQWRNRWNSFLTACDNIITFSENSKSLLEKSYKLNNITVAPHSVNYMMPLNKKYKFTNTLNIGLLGTLNYHKGIEIIKKILKVIEKSNLNVNIILIGSTIEQISSKHFKQTGPYTVEMIPKLIFKNDIDLFLISSVCPETFSYTTQEIISMNLPIVCFNIGAQAERVKYYCKGLVLNNFDSDDALNKIMDFSENFNYKATLKNKKVLFIAEYISFSSRYRVEHFQEQLLINGIQSDFELAENLESCDLNKYESIIIYRCAYNNSLGKLIDYCHKNKIKVFYDIDDYIFEYDKIKGLDFLEGKEYKNFEKYSLNIFKCMQCCDGFMTSTENMKQAIISLFDDKHICVNRNVASMEMLIISLKAKNEIVKDKEKVVIGYFSGSKTHDKDFEIISEVLLKMLKEYKNVYLKIVGCLNLPEKFCEFKERIHILNFVEWKELPYLIASVDINLLPVEDTFFHSCKSENKWTEAALVCVPTVASCNTELSHIFKNGEEGMLCANKKEWEDNLSSLITNSSLRTSIGYNAHKVVLDKYITYNSGTEAIKFITK